MMLRTVPTVQVSMIVAVAVVGSATAAVAQDRKWEVEVHGGGTVATNPTGGTAALPAAGTPLSLPPPREAYPRARPRCRRAAANHPGTSGMAQCW